MRHPLFYALLFLFPFFLFLFTPFIFLSLVKNQSLCIHIFIYTYTSHMKPHTSFPCENKLLDGYAAVRSSSRVGVCVCVYYCST
jgi:hypothetical protein